MLIVERMTRNPATITADATVGQALEIVEIRDAHHLPVIDAKGSLVGIVSEKDLLRASCEDLVGEVMTTEVITASEYTELEEAARVMVDHKISSLPVLRADKLVGIITETDLFNIFLELLGARERGVRLTMLIPEEKGMLASVTREIAALNGNILALGTFRGEDHQSHGHCEGGGCSP